ncbi:hypothetical protein EVAR_742_1 [Eumeta japonica]|uniref:Uncharacterized protein n=1 Tax=Eumeta variegata TaxID=151549 RepID=A0A4C1SEL2_EUMVA|nr:hypothetical protein EVAR_742_1 [Eumeta japonica]
MPANARLPAPSRLTRCLLRSVLEYKALFRLAAHRRDGKYLYTLHNRKKAEAGVKLMCARRVSACARRVSACARDRERLSACGA